MKFDKKVEEVFAAADAAASAKKLRSYGTPHVMLCLMETKDFQSSYTGEFDAFRKSVEAAVKMYACPPVAGLQGYDLVSIKNVVLPDIYKRYGAAIKTDVITLGHLFLGLCAEVNSDSVEPFCLDYYLEINGVDKMEVFFNLITYCDVDSDDVDFDKLKNYRYTINIDAKDVSRSTYKKSDECEEKKTSTASGRTAMHGKSMAGLENFCTDLIEKAKTYDKPFIGREDVIQRTMQVLCKAEKSNPVHVGEPGVGKSAVTKGLAKMILENKVPDILKGSKLYELDITALVAGTCYRGDFEKRIKMVLDELSKIDKVILFIDEIHMIIGAGSGESSPMDAANILKPYLTEGNIKFIGATTYNEYSRYIEKDPALMRRFQKIDISEPSVKDAIKIIDGLKEHYEKYHGLEYTDAAIRASVELTARHIHDRRLPDKAIDMIDEAGAFVNVTPGHPAIVDENDVEEIISQICKIPRKSLEKDELNTVSDLEKILNTKVFGQGEAIEAVAESIKLSKSGLADENKPIGAFLFVGPSGVGKTELAKQLADSMSMKLIRFDMSEYADSLTVSKLIGSSAGYVGYEEGGLLTNALLKDPHCVLLLDEIEKAHPDIFKTFLQMFDYGMLTDNKGRKVDCRQAIIIMTSNAGVENASKPALGFLQTDSVNTDAITDAVNKLFRVEFRNRLTGIITFNGLNEEMSVLVVKKELNTLKEKLAKKGIKATFTEACIKKLAKEGTSYEFGARNLQRLIDTEIKKKFVTEIINKTPEKEYIVDVADDKYALTPVKETETVTIA